MPVHDIIWLESVVDKIESKHQLSPEEVEEVFLNRPRYRNAQKGKFEGDNLYYAYGRTDSGRYVFVVFIYKRNRKALIISACDMDKKEKRKYGKN
jgi:uncharacterized protein